MSARPSSFALAWCLAGCAATVVSGAPHAGAAQRTRPIARRGGSPGAADVWALGCAEPGFGFTVDTPGETGPNAGVLAPIRGAVTFAAGRGRLDVVAVRRAPSLAVRGVRVAASLAAPGDYYLFDGAGAVLVRPASRTYARLALADASYNY